ncbi:hypothetical protein ACJQWK_02637 [Exserohilum turcicum]
MKQSIFDPLGIKGVIEVLKADKEHRLLQYFKKRSDLNCDEQGNPINTLTQHLLGTKTVFTTDPRNVQAILATQFKDFGLGRVRNATFAPLLGHGIFSSDGEQWAKARALLRPQFARDQVSNLELEEQHVQHLMRVIPMSSNGWTEVTDLEPLFFRLTIDSATEFLFGESVDSQLSALPDYKSSRGTVEQDFATAFDQALNAISIKLRFGDAPWLVYNKMEKVYNKRCHASIDHYIQLALSKDKTARQNSTEKQKYVFLDALVEANQDPVELRSHLISILLAGRDTTASLLSYVFMSLAQHPEVYEKLRGVVKDSFGTYSNPKNMTFEALKSCNFLQWVLNEALRLYPVVPLNSRRALRDTTLPTGGGPDGTAPIYIKEDMSVDYHIYTIHRRKDLWGQDADEFRPDRWDGRKSGWEYLPFNGGARICIGQQFALTEAAYTVVRLAQRFEKIESAGNLWDGSTKGGSDHIKHNLSLTTCPAGGVKLRMKEARE